MAVIEKAIKIFEGFAQCNYQPTRDAAQLAVSALREKLARQQNDPPTNADRIRAMSDEELAAFLLAQTAV